MPVTSLTDFFSIHQDIDQQASYAVALSGGPDSMALAHLLIEWAQAHQKKLYLLTVDHGLRPEAKAEAQMIAHWAASLEKNFIHHEILTWAGEKPPTGIMEAARSARYHLMATYCHDHKINTLFIAHHQDDQAETFLIRLSKGSGLDGLAAMGTTRQYNDELILARPLLNVSKQEIIDYCTVQNLPTINDPSNQNSDYLRPRLRASMQVLEQEGLSAKRLAMTAKRMARARRALEEITQRTYAECLIDNDTQKTILDFDRLHQEPEEIGLRVLQMVLESARIDADYQVRMEKLEELFAAIWHQSSDFKPRTLGGYVFSLKSDKTSKNTSLWIEKEKG